MSPLRDLPRHGVEAQLVRAPKEPEPQDAGGGGLDEPPRAVSQYGGGPEDEDAYRTAYERYLLGRADWPHWDDFGLASDIAAAIRDEIDNRLEQTP